MFNLIVGSGHWYPESKSLTPIIYQEECNNIGYFIPGPAGDDKNCTQIDCCCCGQKAHVHELNANLPVSGFSLQVRFKVSVPREYNQSIKFGELGIKSFKQMPIELYGGKAKVKISVLDESGWENVASVSYGGNGTYSYKTYLFPEEYDKVIKQVKIEIVGCYATGKFLNPSSSTPGIYDYRRVNLTGCHLDWSEVGVYPLGISPVETVSNTHKSNSLEDFLNTLDLIFSIAPFIFFMIIIYAYIKVSKSPTRKTPAAPRKQQKPRRPGFWG